MEIMKFTIGSTVNLQPFTPSQYNEIPEHEKHVHPFTHVVSADDFLLASCSNTDTNVQADPVDTAQQAKETLPEADTAPSTASLEVEPSQQPEEAVPTTVAEPTAAPSPTPLPVFPNRRMLAYFDFLPDYDDLPDFYQLNCHRIYDAARYDDHYSLRVVYQGNNYSLQGCYLGATVTVADEGVLQPDQLSERYTNVTQVEFPRWEKARLFCAAPASLPGCWMEISISKSPRLARNLRPHA